MQDSIINRQFASSFTHLEHRHERGLSSRAAQLADCEGHREHIAVLVQRHDLRIGKVCLQYLTFLTFTLF